MVGLSEQRRVGEMRLEKQPEARARRASWDMVGTLSSVFIGKHQGALGRRLAHPAENVACSPAAGALQLRVAVPRTFGSLA